MRAEGSFRVGPCKEAKTEKHVKKINKGKSETPKGQKAKKQQTLC